MYDMSHGYFQRESLGGDTKNHWSLLPGFYAGGSKRFNKTAVTVQKLFLHIMSALINAR